MSSYTVKKTIDARGSYCPGPLMELVRIIKEIEIGDVVDLLSSDEGSSRDIPKWIDKAGHKLIEIKEDEGFKHFVVEKGEKVRRERRSRN